MRNQRRPRRAGSGSSSGSGPGAKESAGSGERCELRFDRAPVARVAPGRRSDAFAQRLHTRATHTRPERVTSNKHRPPNQSVCMRCSPLRGAPCCRNWLAITPPTLDAPLRTAHVANPLFSAVSADRRSTSASASRAVVTPRRSTPSARPLRSRSSPTTRSVRLQWEFAASMKPRC